MKWYRNLYLGENAAKAKYKIFGHIRKSMLDSDTFLIMISENENNLLDIISANEVLQPHFKKKYYRKRIYVVGLAKGRNEALEVVRNIIDDVYKNTEKFDVAGYLKFGQKLKKK